MGEPTGSKSLDLVLSLALAAVELNAMKLVVLDVSALVHWCSYFLLATASNRPQMATLLFRIDSNVNTFFGSEVKSRFRSKWELLDLGEIIVHVMFLEERTFYDMECLYYTAKELSL